MTAPNRIRVAVNGYGVIGKRVAAAVIRQDDMSRAVVSGAVTRSRIALIRIGDGLVALNAVRELMADRGRPHDNPYEVLWEDMLRVQDDEPFYAYMVDNQAIVIPETIDAIRALTGIVQDANESIARTNAALGIEPSMV